MKKIMLLIVSVISLNANPYAECSRYLKISGFEMEKAISNLSIGMNDRFCLSYNNLYHALANAKRTCTEDNTLKELDETINLYKGIKEKVCK